MTIPGVGRASFIGDLKFFPDGKTLASLGSWGDDMVRLWNVADGTPRTTLRHTGDDGHIVISPDGRTLLGLFTETHRHGRGPLADKTYSWVVFAWDLDDSGQKRGRRRVFETKEGAHLVWTIVISPDGSTLAVVDSGRIFLLEAPAWNVRTEMDPQGPAYATTAAFSPDGATLATQGAQGAQLWDVKSGRFTTTLPVDGDPRGSDVEFSPDGKHLASGCRQGLVVWNVFTRRVVKTVRSSQKGGPSLGNPVYSPDGAFLAASSGAGMIHFFKRPDYTESAAFMAEKKGLTVMAFSPDGKTLATGSHDRTINLWDVAELVGR